MSSHSSRPPTASSDADTSWRPVELVAHELDATEPAAPTNSTTGGGPAGLSGFVHVIMSTLPDVDPDDYNELVAAPPNHTAVRHPPKQSEYPLPAPGASATNNGGASLTPFIHINNSLYPDDDDWLPSRDEVNAPGLSTFVQDNNSLYPDVDVDPNNNIPNLDDDDASLTTTCVNTLRKCFVCLSKRNWPQILSVSQRVVPIVKQMLIHPAVTFPETTTISKASHHMFANSCYYLVLVDSNSSITGIVTSEDIFNITRTDVAYDTPVSEVMTKNPIFVYSDTPALEAVQKMAKGNVTGLLVIEDGKVIGLLILELCQAHYQQEIDTGGCIEPAMAAIAQWNLG